MRAKFLLIAIANCLAVIFVGCNAQKKLIKSQQAAREAAAMQELNNIGRAQLMHSVTQGQGKFTTLERLAGERLIDPALASGKKGGFIFTTTPIEAAGLAPMFDVTARPETAGEEGTGNRSFYTNENHVVYEAEGGEPPTATPQDRVPKNGKPIE